MTMERDAMEKEAIRRLTVLDLHKNVVNDFKYHKRLNCSHLTKFGPAKFGALFWLTDKEQKMVTDIEKKYDILVYHVTHEKSKIGETYDLLYVSSWVDEWSMDTEDLAEHTPMAYVFNKTNPDFSEFGHIGIKSVGGGLIRTM